jgi:hypothetical protein
VVDSLPFQILDCFRYKTNQKKKNRIVSDIQKRCAEEGEEIIKPKFKRVKNVYLLNKNKYWVELKPEEVKKDLDMDNRDEDTHRILQYKIR